MTFGIFNDEGLLEGDFFSRDVAQATLKACYADEQGAYVAEVCHDHPEEQAGLCEACDADEEAEDE